MNILAQWFGKKAARADDEGALADLVHKVELALTESPKVAMRLIERRSPAVDRAADYGHRGHGAFVDLVLKALNQKHAAAHPDAAPLAAGSLPGVACYREQDAADLESFLALVRRQAEPLCQLRNGPENRVNNVLLGIEAQLIFAGEPRAVLVIAGDEDFMTRRELLAEAAAGIDKPVGIRQVPEFLEGYLRREESGAGEKRLLTEFGYPVRIFFRKD